MWTNCCARIRSYQILTSVVAIVLVVEQFRAVQKILWSTRLISNRNYRIKSYWIIAKRHTSHLIVVPNRDDRDWSWTRQSTHVLLRCVTITHDLLPLRSLTRVRGPLLRTCHEWPTNRYELICENASSYAAFLLSYDPLRTPRLAIRIWSWDFFEILGLDTKWCGLIRFDTIGCAWMRKITIGQFCP